MEKIIVLSSQSINDNALITCLEMLFPDCEIEVRFTDRKELKIRDSYNETSEDHTSNPVHLCKMIISL